MDSLQKKRLRQRLLVILPSIVLVVAVAVSMMHPSEAEREEAELTQSILAHRPGQLPPEQREQWRSQWQNLTPESRDRVFRAIATARLDEFREESKGLSKEERQQRIQQRIDEIRQRRKQLTAAERQQLRERLSQQEAKEIVANVLEFYQDELSARERAELDPLIYEWLYNLDSIVNSR
jgi:endonuclease/exonuclease/phosphatase (EEP) superfamily protein YafD